jgi:hypothetical protein
MHVSYVRVYTNDVIAINPYQHPEVSGTGMLRAN